VKHLILAALLMMQATMAQADITGNQFLGLPDNEELAYVVGIVDGVSLMTKGNCFKGTEYPQINAMVIKFLRDNPEYRHLAMSGIFSVIIYRYLPCEEKADSSGKPEVKW
jgi:hypothetical protein